MELNFRLEFTEPVKDSRDTIIMRAFQTIISACAMLFLFSVSAPAQTPKVSTTNFQLGNTVVTIPAPAGFEEAASQFESIKNHFTLTEAQGNDMLAVHLPREDCERLRAGEAGRLSFYTKISLRQAIRDLDYSAAQFANLIAEFRKNGSQILDINSPKMKETVERLSKSLSELSKQETQVDLSQPVNLGEFDNRPNVYSVMLLMNLKTQSSEGEATTSILGGLSFVRVKQRLIYVYTYRKYESKADVEVLRDFTKQWVGQILAAN